MSSSSGQRRQGRRDRHGWLSLEAFLSIHDATIRRFEDHFIEQNGLSIRAIDDRLIEIAGRLRCRHGLFIDVRELLEVNERRQVRTFKYSYHAGIGGPPVRSVFRYDDAHT